MKRSLLLLLPALLALASCGTAAQYASNQMFPDGVYYRPEPVVELYTDEDFAAMAARQLAAKQVADTLATVQEESPDYADYYPCWYPYANPYYSPYWGWRSYAWGPSWTWGGIYDPWWDPYWGPSWYGGGWYGPHWYGGAGWWYGGPGYMPGGPLHRHPGPAPSGFASSGRSNPGSYLTGGNNYRRSALPGSSGQSVSRSTQAYRRSSVTGGNARSSVGSTSRSSVSGTAQSGYRRSGDSGVTRSSSSPSYDYSRSSSSSRSSSYSGGGFSGGGYSGGGGGFSGGGGGSHSGGSGGGGGGRR